jgi:hypothetical protein
MIRNRETKMPDYQHEIFPFYDLGIALWKIRTGRKVSRETWQAEMQAEYATERKAYRDETEQRDAARKEKWHDDKEARHRSKFDHSWLGQVAPDLYVPPKNLRSEKGSQGIRGCTATFEIYKDRELMPNKAAVM